MHVFKLCDLPDQNLAKLLQSCWVPLLVIQSMQPC